MSSDQGETTRREDQPGAISLETSYLGLSLKSPLVPSASPLNGSIDNLRRMEDAGAAAVVLPPLFQEQIVGKFNDPNWSLTHGIEPYPETLSYLPNEEDFLADPDAHLERLSHARSALSIPVIASLSGAAPGEWLAFASKLEEAGAAALELNIYHVPTDPSVSADAIEESYATMVRDVRRQIRIPLAVKLAPFFTNFPRVAARLVENGANGLVLFNRLFQADIQLDTLNIVRTIAWSTSEDSKLPMRWIGLLRNQIPASFAATGGVHRGADALKLIMAGADVTMVCSAMIRCGIDVIRAIETQMTMWMETHGYTSLDQIRGMLSCERCADPSAFERSNYVWAAAALRKNVRR
jgi:dihydroorotate dehydrogenase (fumarate)